VNTRPGLSRSEPAPEKIPGHHAERPEGEEPHHGGRRDAAVHRVGDLMGGRDLNPMTLRAVMTNAAQSRLPPQRAPERPLLCAEIRVPRRPGTRVARGTVTEGGRGPGEERERDRRGRDQTPEDRERPAPAQGGDEPGVQRVEGHRAGRTARAQDPHRGPARAHEPPRDDRGGGDDDGGGSRRGEDAETQVVVGPRRRPAGGDESRAQDQSAGRQRRPRPHRNAEPCRPPARRRRRRAS
jgi:hypothetical protein